MSSLNAPARFVSLLSLRAALTLVLFTDSAVPAAEFQIRAISRADPSLPTATAAFDSASAVEGYSASVDGRFVVFNGWSPNLLPDFTIRNSTVFIRDAESGVLFPVSTNFADPSSGANHYSGSPEISTDGSTVVFESRATDLVSGYSGTGMQVFAWNRLTGEVDLISRAWNDPLRGATGGSRPLAVSADGRFVYFWNYGGDLLPDYAGPDSNEQIYLADRATGEVKLITRALGQPAVGATGTIWDSSMSADGRYLAFSSAGANLLPGDSGEGYHVYLFDRLSGSLALASRSASAPQTYANGTSLGAVLSADGSTLAFDSWATDLLPVPIQQQRNIFVVELSTQQYSLVSSQFDVPGASANGESSLASLSADGRFVTFSTKATDWFEVPLTTSSEQVAWLDRSSGERRLVSHIPGSTTLPSAGGNFQSMVSADGRRVVFESLAWDLSIPPLPLWNPTQVFTWSSETENVDLVSADFSLPEGSQDHVDLLWLAQDGLTTVIDSAGGNLVDGDWNRGKDIFRADLDTLSLSPISRRDPALPAARTGNLWSRFSDSGWVSEDGRFSLFWSYGENLTPDSPRGVSPDPSLYLYDAHSDELERIGSQYFVVTGFSKIPSKDRGGKLASLGGYYFEHRPMSSSGKIFGYGAIPQEGDPHVQSIVHDHGDSSDRLVSHRFDDATVGGNDTSIPVAVSPDGHRVILWSRATDLVPSYTGTGMQLFLYDLTNGIQRLVTHLPGALSSGADGNHRLLGTSYDGRWIFFGSDSVELLPLGSASEHQIYMFDALDSSISLVSHAAGSATIPCQAGAWSTPATVSQDGRFVAFHSTSADLMGLPASFPEGQIFVWDRLSHLHRLATPAFDVPLAGANGGSSDVRISRDGRFLTFRSTATNLTSGFEGPAGQIYRTELASADVRLVSRSHTNPSRGASSDSWAPSISADGRRIAFFSVANDLIASSSLFKVHAYLWEALDDSILGLTLPPPETPVPNPNDIPLAQISADGRRVIFEHHTGYLVERDWNQDHGAWDVFLATETPPGLIFLDGFSSGDTSRWSVAAP